MGNWKLVRTHRCNIYNFQNKHVVVIIPRCRDFQVHSTAVRGRCDNLGDPKSRDKQCLPSPSTDKPSCPMPRERSTSPTTAQVEGTSQKRARTSRSPSDRQGYRNGLEPYPSTVMEGIACLAIDSRQVQTLWPMARCQWRMHVFLTCCRHWTACLLSHRSLPLLACLNVSLFDHENRHRPLNPNDSSCLRFRPSRQENVHTPLTTSHRPKRLDLSTMTILVVEERDVQTRQKWK
jgi:hypothetical protein